MLRPVRHTCVTHRRSHRIGGGALWVLGLFWFLYAMVVAAAEPPRALVLLSETGGAYRELADSLMVRLAEKAPDRLRLEVRLAPDSTTRLDELLATRPALVVPVGIRATAQVLREAGTIPVLSLLVPYDSYLSLIDVHDGAQTRRSGIYLDQPLDRQLNLLTLVLPTARNIAMLSSQNSRQHVAELERLCRQRGLTLTWQTVASGDNPVPALARLMDQADVLLALPDPGIFNRSSVQAILLTTYRSGVPVLGFSQAYVRAGALAAVHSTAGQIGRQAGEWIAELANTGNWELGAPRYPSYYSVSVNAQVAQSLGISVNNEDVLLERLQQLENPQP